MKNNLNLHTAIFLIIKKANIVNISSHYISDFLRQNGFISLEKIGELSLPENPQTNEEGELLSEAVFVYDKKAETTPDFVHYLAGILQKPLLLVQSDLEYFLDQSRQLMNIGSKPLEIDGIGFIHAENNGTYSFSTTAPDGFKETAFHKKYDEAHQSGSPMLSSVNYASKRKGGRNLGRWILLILLIGIIAFGFYYVKSKPDFFTDNQVKNDSIKNEKIAERKDISAPIVKITSSKVDGYKFIIQTFDNLQGINKRVTQLKNYGNIVSTDSIRVNGKTIYRLYVTDEKATPADTLHIKDSLRAYFGHTITIE